MTRSEFDYQIIRLQEVYGEKKYPEERQKIFWERFNEVDDRTFTETVSNLIADSERAPMAKDLMAILRPIINEIRMSKERAEEAKKCPTCKDNGMVYVGGWEGPLHGGGFTDNWKRCHCLFGRQHSHLGPVEKDIELTNPLDSVPSLFRELNI